MATFKVGDRVRVVDGPRKGEVTTVISSLCPFYNVVGYAPLDPRVRNGMMVHWLDLEPLHPGTTHVAALPEWLRHYYDGNEKGEWTEELRNLCREKESA